MIICELKYLNHNFVLIYQQDPDTETMEWPTAEELNLALPPPIKEVQALSLVLSISNVTVTLYLFRTIFVMILCSCTELLHSIFTDT